jgi:hypothetical protein
MTAGTMTMAKEKEDMPVKIEHDVYRKLRVVAAWHNVGMSKYLSQVLGPILDKEMGKMAREVTKGQTDKKPDAN